MDEKVEQKPPKQMSRKLNVNIGEFNLEDFKKHSHLIVSPTLQESKSKQISRWKSCKSTCLCSPTTHVGSFRCRHHRSGSMHRGGSVGSNLSSLAAKSEPISDSLQAQ
ncbi:hypothetical protein CIPAW_11G206800 [Carya illinoinensis]|uniref:Uncharacterized protein n=1 Tax=Carya illinoinensis TaxID=32201 RepID=A0A8T1PA44_CARIL|nr:hypothetical protein CIPAW_11G206800 [Carya illinoinensis]